MEAKLVERAEYEPAKCMLTGAWAEPDHPLIDFGGWCPGIDPRIYLAPALVRDVARNLLEMVDGEALTVSEREIDRLQLELEAVRSERDEAIAKVQAIDVIESADFRSRKKTGRPRKEVGANA